MSKEQQEAALQKAKDCAFNMYDVVDGEEVPWAKNKYEGDIGVKFFMEGWRQSISREGQEGGWVDVKERLPEYVREICGNKATDNVLVFNGEDIYHGYLEAVRPDFVNKFWCDPMSEDNLEEYAGKKVTHWQPLPSPPKPKTDGSGN